jgi:hypothetical protein
MDDGDHLVHWVRVSYPAADEDARRDDHAWLRDATRRNGGEYPDAVHASIPPQVVLGFPEAFSSRAFQKEITQDGRFMIRGRGAG